MGKKYRKDMSKDMNSTTMEDKKDVRNSRGGRRTAKSKSTSDEKSRFVSSLGRPTNDPRWYLNNPSLSRDVGSIWFSKPTGSYLPKSAILIQDTSDITNDQYEPGILAIPTMTTWGGTVGSHNNLSDVSNDAVNLTAQKLYQYVVHANSRNISYDKKDLIMTIMAIDGIYQMITEAIRAYRLIASYDPENKFVNRLLEAMNWDPNSLHSSVAEFRYLINWAIARVNKFYVPGIFDMIKAHMACYEHIYADRPSPKAQYIVKYSKGFWLYDDVHGDLNYVTEYRNSIGVNIDWGTSKHTPLSWDAAIRTMISGVENAQYLGVMQGDLLKAFGVGNLMQYTYLGIDMPIAPVYDEEFMLKLHNADIANDDHSWIYEGHSKSMMVYRDDDAVTGNMLAVFMFQAGPQALVSWRQTHGMLIDLPTHIPATPDSILLMSLYKLLGWSTATIKWRLTDTDAHSFAVGQLPPEVMLPATLYYDPNDMNHNITIHTWAQSLSTCSFMSRFETGPLLTETNVGENMSNPIFWKTDNVSDISWESVRRIFEVVYWSLWASSAITSTVSREERV